MCRGCATDLRLGNRAEPSYRKSSGVRLVEVHPGGNPGANFKSISHRCYLLEVALVQELTKETIDLPLGCLQGAERRARTARRVEREM